MLLFPVLLGPTRAQICGSAISRLFIDRKLETCSLDILIANPFQSHCWREPTPNHPITDAVREGRACSGDFRFAQPTLRRGGVLVGRCSQTAASSQLVDMERASEQSLLRSNCP